MRLNSTNEDNFFTICSHWPGISSNTHEDIFLKKLDKIVAIKAAAGDLKKVKPCNATLADLVLIA